MHSMSGREVDGLQQMKTSSDSTYVNQKFGNLLYSS